MANFQRQNNYNHIIEARVGSNYNSLILFIFHILSLRHTHEEWLCFSTCNTTTHSYEGLILTNFKTLELVKSIYIYFYKCSITIEKINLKYIGQFERKKEKGVCVSHTLPWITVITQVARSRSNQIALSNFHKALNAQIETIRAIKMLVTIVTTNINKSFKRHDLILL